MSFTVRVFRSDLFIFYAFFEEMESIESVAQFSSVQDRICATLDKVQTRSTLFF